MFISWIRGRVGLLTFYLYAVMNIPFLLLLENSLTFHGVFESEWQWGLAKNIYSGNIDHLIEIGWISVFTATGYILASILTRGTQKQITYALSDYRFRVLSGSSFSLLLLVCVVLIALSTPPVGILDADHGSSKPISSLVNFTSLWMISYLIFLYLIVDIFTDVKRYRKKCKTYSIILVTLWILYYAQLRTGDREFFTMLIAIFLFKYFILKSVFTEHGRFQFITLGRKISVSSILMLTVISILMLVIFYTIGTLRSGVVGKNHMDILAHLSETDFSNIIYGTWSSALLGIQSAVVSVKVFNEQLRFGMDYFDLLISIPPGFIADIIGYERPVSSTSSVGIQLIYGLGGNHSSVVPYLNFGLFGVQFFAFFYFLGANHIENKLKCMNAKYVFIYIAVLFAIPHWIWYGEKYIINLFIISFTILMLQKIYITKIYLEQTYRAS